MYRLIETIKISNGIAQNLVWHQKRMDKSFQYLYNKTNPFYLKDIIKPPTSFVKDKVKLRFLYNETSYDMEYSIYKKKTIKTLKLVFDDNIEYHLKYIDRSMLNRLTHNRGQYDDILIVKNGLISDSSYTNIVFFDGKNWVTPASPLLFGTAREKLIYEKAIIPRIIKPHHLKQFKYFRLINAMLKFEEQDKIEITNIIL